MAAAAPAAEGSEIAASAAQDDSGASLDFVAEALKAMQQQPAPPASAESKPATETPAAAATDAKPEQKKIDPAELLSSPKPGSKDYNWAQLKKEKEDALAKAKALEEKLSSIPADLQARLDAIQKERDDLSRRLEEADIERHPKFQTHFKGGFDRIESQLKDIVPGEIGEQIAEIVRDGSFKRNAAALNELVSTLSPADVAQVGALIASGRQLHADRASELARASERKKELLAAEEQQKSQYVQSLTKQFESKIVEVTSEDPLFQERDGEEYRDWNASVKARRDAAKNVLLGNMTPDEAVNAALWAASGPEYRSLLDAQIQLNAKLREQIAALTSARPTAGRDGGGASASKPSGGNGDESFDDFIASTAAMMRGA